MPTVDGIHRSPLWPDIGPEVISINEIAERNHWCMTSQNVQAQRKKKEGRTKCQSSINALLSDVGIVLSQNISPEPGVLPLPLISGISFSLKPHTILPWSCLATLTFSQSPAQVIYVPGLQVLASFILLVSPNLILQRWEEQKNFSYNQKHSNSCCLLKIKH